MFYYKLYGKNLYSDIEIPQLVSISPFSLEEADFIFREGVVEDEIKRNEPKQMISFGDRRSWLINDTMWFKVLNGRELVYELKSGAKELLVRSFLVGYGQAMLHLQRGELCIHCSAISDGETAYLVAGDSGSGKSTLTSRFLKNGFQLMADDCALVKKKEDGRVMVYPAFPYQKLCRDEVVRQGLAMEELIYIDEDRDKFLVPYKGEFSLEGKRLGGIFCLKQQSGEGELITQEITGIGKLRYCAYNLFLRAFLGNQVYNTVLGPKCLEVAANVPMYIIVRPEGKDTAQVIWEYVESVLHNLP